MLYTRKGDDGSTKAFNTKSGVRISKSSCQTASLGALDELNSFLGLVKVRSANLGWRLEGKLPVEIIHEVQNCLFTVQAEVAGSDKKIIRGKVETLEKLTDAAEKELPPIKTFFIPGGSEAAALFDVARTLARKAEREVIGAAEKGEIEVGPETLSYLNRLSSLLYALARLSNHKSGINELAPSYE